MRYKMRSSGGHKIGVKASALKGRAAYLYADGGEASLLIRNFRVNASGDYIDVPSSEPDNFGSAFQACSVDIDSVAFSELEYHVPAVPSSDGNLHSMMSRSCGFLCTFTADRRVARRLLSEEIELEMPLLN